MNPNCAGGNSAHIIPTDEIEFISPLRKPIYTQIQHICLTGNIIHVVQYFYQALCQQLNNFSLYLAPHINLNDLSIAQPHRKDQTYRIREILHRGHEVVLVQLACNTALYRRCKELGGRSTRRLKGWWWPVSEWTVEKVRMIFHCTPNQNHRTLLMRIYSGVLRIGETLAIKPAGMQSGKGSIYMRGGKGIRIINSSFMGRCMPFLGGDGCRMCVYKRVVQHTKRDYFFAKDRTKKRILEQTKGIEN